MAKVLTRDERNSYILIEGVSDIEEDGNMWNFVLDGILHQVGKTPCMVSGKEFRVQRWLIEQKMGEWRLKWKIRNISVEADVS